MKGKEERCIWDDALWDELLKRWEEEDKRWKRMDTLFLWAVVIPSVVFLLASTAMLIQDILRYYL